MGGSALLRMPPRAPRSQQLGNRGNEHKAIGRPVLTTASTTGSARVLRFLH